MKLLIVEDEPDLNRNLVKRLKAESFSVDSAFDGPEALEYLRMVDYDLVICDIMLPGFDGFSLLQKARNLDSSPPFIFLTARDSITDKIHGLDIGASDYLVKPFDFGELLARIRVQLRKQTGQETALLTAGPLALDSLKKTVTLCDKNIPLTAKEYQILHYLLQHKNHILSREQILNHVWDLTYDGASNMVDVMIKNIRQKCRQVSPTPIILTKRGLGYVITD